MNGKQQTWDCWLRAGWMTTTPAVFPAKQRNAVCGKDEPPLLIKVVIAMQRTDIFTSWLGVVGLTLLLLSSAACASGPVPVAAPAATAIPLPLAAQRSDFPAAARPADNPQNAAKIELGRQLFYDPILSSGRAMSCAHCHRPDMGFSNGAAVSTARPGAPPRNVPSLWNVAFTRQLTWDGHVESLEAQAIDPLTLPHEMASNPAEIEARLGALPAYQQAFTAAFDSADAITFVNVTRALAAFQRTLLSRSSAFDRYVAGDTAALTATEQRGMVLFFSERTRCAECHVAPAFTQETFRVIGVPSDDPGRAAVNVTGLHGAFKIPTLRNVARTAPYMHNDAFPTLEAVIQFYAAGAGRAQGFPLVDSLLQGFTLSGEEQADLVAFLGALTDESALPPVPSQALSGLPVP